MRHYLSMTANQAVDRYAIQTCDIPGATLMENAGREFVETLELAGYLTDTGLRVLVICGKGNNGGDGFVIARQLKDRGITVRILLIPAVAELQGEAQHHFQRARDAGVEMISFTGDDKSLDMLQESSLIVDAMLGTGIRGTLRDPYSELITAINDNGVPVVSVDVPSGVSGDIGEVLDPCVQAVMTVSMGFGKLGTLFEPARSFSGQRVIVDIGFPDDSAEHSGSQAVLEVFADDFPLDLLHRSADVHKYQAGKVLIVAASPGFTGAAVLAARAAVRSGAGLVRLAVPESLGDLVEPMAIEPVVERCPQTLDRSFALAARDGLLEMAEWADCVALGPGIGRNGETVQLLLEIIPEIRKPLVVDADALYALAQKPEILHLRQAPTLLTPHQGEFARLRKQDQAAGWPEALEFARTYGCMVLLKGAPSLLATDEGQVFVNSTGHAGLATGGSGDVLTGMAAGLWSQNPASALIPVLAMTKHGQCADLLREEKGILGLIASDLIEILPAALREFGA